MTNVLTKDNGVHALFCIAVTVFGGLLVGWPLAWAAGAGVAIYLREASQVGWRWGLEGSGHKWAEALTGPLAGLGVAVLMLAV